MPCGCFVTDRTTRQDRDIRLDISYCRTHAQAFAMREVLRELAEFWDAGSPVHPGSEVSGSACAILKELDPVGRSGLDR